MKRLARYPHLRGTLFEVGLLAALLVTGIVFLSHPQPPPPTGLATPSAGPVASGSAPPDVVEVNPLPTPATIDVVLLVGDAAALADRETMWLDDLRAELGRVDVLAYGDASAGRLASYLTIVVIDKSDE